VADTAALLDVMAGYTVGDPYWLPNPDTSFYDLSQRSPTGLKVALITELPPIGAAHPMCKQAVLDTARRLEALGHHVEPLQPPDLGPLIEPFTVAWQCIVSEANVPWLVLEKMNRWLLWRAWRVGSGAYLRAIAQLQAVSRQIVQHFYACDLILLPTYLSPTIPIGAWRSVGSAQTLQNIINWIAPCPPFNASGQPAIAIPTGFDDSGLPVGVQLVGRPAADATVLAVAAQLEQMNPWAHQRPSLVSS
jgi:amidase